MSRKIKTVYEYFKEYSEEMIDKVLSKLNTAEKELLTIRYGEDLHNPCPKKEWGSKYHTQFYKVLIPKIRTLLEVEKAKDIDIVKEKEEESNNIQENIKEDTKEVEISSIPNYSIYDLNNYKLLINLINKNVSNIDICKQLNITFSELTAMLLELKNLGLSFQRKYYSNGIIKYIPASELGVLSKSNKKLEAAIITDVNEDEIKILATADFHYCNKSCRPDLVAKAFDYCVQNGIHIIMCAGDLLDGTFPPGKQTIAEPYEQVKYFLENYPHDDSILTFAVGGNHDISVLNSSYIDLRYATTNYRPDIIIPGYCNCTINIKNDSVLLHHHVDNICKASTKSTILLHGHSHKFKVNDIYNNGLLEIWVPTLSNILQIMPTVLEMTLKFKNGIISHVNIKQVMLENKPIVLGEYDYYKDNNLKVENISNNEDYKIGNKINQEDKFDDDFGRSSMSQTEKFNKRYKL